MPTVVVHHDVRDTEHWLASPKRAEFLEPLGVSDIRTFVDPQRPNHVALVMEIADLDAVLASLQTQQGADVMDSDGVMADTLTFLVER